jgi:hypothetical protein
MVTSLLPLSLATKETTPVLPKYFPVVETILDALFICNG